MIQFRDIKKAFGPKVVLGGVSFDVQDGEVFFIIGASGAGKSVCIKHLVGLMKPDSGQVLLDGEDIAQLTEEQFYRIRMKVAMVFQHSTLFDSMTCAENVALPLRKHKGMKPKDAKQEAMKRLELVNMREFADRYPAELGDGMRKRVAIARALTMDPRYVLFDEPTTSLDPVSARRVDRLIRELSDKVGVTSIVVSHDLVSIFSIANRIAMVYQGGLRKVGTPAEFKAVDDPVIQQFITGTAEGPMVV
ncbi:MAG: ATP-binding cassette domain-containing protein [Myxococcales bacterium]|nr:ATP-binding cassette domain-containing protein [Myxococcales bacterium]MBL8716551.1 ATP-binding cassette domain-containing protein [Myxococcales bacterium]